MSAVDRGIVDYPSDDPRTPIANDPTRDVVGNVPLLFATKRAVLQVDKSSPGIVDPGDTLRYTITIYNTGSIPATSVTLRGQRSAEHDLRRELDDAERPAGRRSPTAASSPLAAGIYVSSTDLHAAAADRAQGTLSPNSSAVVQFDLRVNDGVAAGTVISNQATVRTPRCRSC